MIGKLSNLNWRQEMALGLTCFAVGAVGVGVGFLADALSMKWLAYLGIGIFLLAWLGMMFVIVRGFLLMPRRIATNFASLRDMPRWVQAIALAALIGLLTAVVAAYVDLGPVPLIGSVVFFAGSILVMVYAVWSGRAKSSQPKGNERAF
jgi:hypothetical protein